MQRSLLLFVRQIARISPHGTIAGTTFSVCQVNPGLQYQCCNGSNPRLASTRHRSRATARSCSVKANALVHFDVCERSASCSAMVTQYHQHYSNSINPSGRTRLQEQLNPSSMLQRKNITRHSFFRSRSHVCILCKITSESYGANANSFGIGPDAFAKRRLSSRNYWSGGMAERD